MIYHNRYLTITDIREMGQYTFDNLIGYEDFAKKAKKGDIIDSTAKISEQVVHVSKQLIALYLLEYNAYWLNLSVLYMREML